MEEHYNECGSIYTYDSSYMNVMDIILGQSQRYTGLISVYQITQGIDLILMDLWHDIGQVPCHNSPSVLCVHNPS